MSGTVPVEEVKSTMLDVLKETFEQVSGIFLDKGTSLFETLATISAEEASRPVSATCASIAAQVEHVRFYLDVLEQYMRGTPPAEKVDWKHIWLTVREVTPEEWEAVNNRLKASYERVKSLLQTLDTWDGVSE